MTIDEIRSFHKRVADGEVTGDGSRIEQVYHAAVGDLLDIIGPWSVTDETSELKWLMGWRTAWRRVLSAACRELGYDDPEVGKAKWIGEREEAVATLRRACEGHGDNDWDNDLHLSDVIDAHLLPYLEER